MRNCTGQAVLRCENAPGSCISGCCYTGCGKRLCANHYGIDISKSNDGAQTAMMQYCKYNIGDLDDNDNLVNDSNQ